MKPEVFELQASLEQSHWWFLGRRAVLRALLAAVLPPRSGATVVDVGCGTGGNIGALTEGYRCIGLEPAPAALDLARKRFPEVHFIAGADPALVAPYLGARTMVLLTDVLEHVPDDFLFFSQLLAVMPAGSQLLLTVPANPALWSPHDLALAHYRRYERERLQLVWQSLPVRERLLSPYNARLYPLVRLRRIFAGLTEESSGPRGTDLSLPPAPVNRLLTRLFAGEGRALLAALDSGKPAFHRGVSLLALLERRPGSVAARTRPDAVPPDQHDPRAA